MFQRIYTGMALARCSWQVLKTDKQLLLFPVLSGFCCLLVLASFIVPFALRPEWLNFFDAKNPNGFQIPIWTYVVAFLFYFCNYFVVIFFNAALISCALIRFNGGTPTLGDGLSAAGARLPQILAWAFVSATVGVVLWAIENIHERLGAFVAFLLGAAWSLLTFFVVPVLVVEKLGPVDAVKRSVSILKRAWGEALVANMGIGGYVFLMALPWILLALLGVWILLGVGSPFGWAFVGLAVAYFPIWLVIVSALNVIHIGALYQYAAHGRVPEGFDATAIQQAFRTK